jgi:hypothetical protein
MRHLVKVKNTGAKETWLGWAIASGTYFQIPPLALGSWEEDPHVYGSIASGTLVVNDGTSDFTDPADGWDWLVADYKFRGRRWSECKCCGRYYYNSRKFSRHRLRCPSCPSTKNNVLYFNHYLYQYDL